MKCKIKEIEFDDGHKEYIPLVKLHWWSWWKSVYSWGELARVDKFRLCDTLDKAKDNISRFIEKYRADKVKRTRDIEVTINIK